MPLSSIMTPAQLAADFADQLAIRAQLESARRDCDTWRAIAREAIHSLAAQYDRVAVLERQKAEMREERERYARTVFPHVVTEARA